MEIIETPVGEFKLGCAVPDSANVFADVPVFGDAVVPWTRDALVRYCASGERMRSRDRFGPKLVRNQGRRGSCNGYAGAKALERARLRRFLDYVELSGEGLYAQINDGRDNGSLLVRGMKALTENGVPRAADVQYEEYRKERISAEAWGRASQFKGFELYQLTTEAELATALASGFDCVVAVHVTNSWTQLTAGGYIPPANGLGNHAIGVDDVIYDAARGVFAFDHYGSWGTEIHEGGYALLTWEGHLRETVKHHGFYAIRSTNDG